MSGRGLAWALLLLAAAVVTAPAEEGPRLPVRGVFLAERLGGRIVAEAQIERLAALPAPGAFPDAPPHPLCRAAASGGLLRLSLVMRLELPGRSTIRIENHLWMEPELGTPCFLLRSRRGLKDYEQAFRFSPQGAVRRQREPATAREAALPPSRWTRIGEHRYPYPEDCASVLETSGLFYRMLADGGAEMAGGEALCVFHKRQVHRVQLEEEDLKEIAFDYLELAGGARERRSGKTAARGLRVSSRPIGTYRGEVEEFLKDGTRLVLRRDGRVPLSAGFEVPLLGWVDLQLVELEWE